MTRTDRYWAAIARDHAQGEVDAVTRIADEEVAVVQARLDDAEARVNRLNDALDRARMERAEAEDAETEMEAEVDKWKTAALEFEAAYVTTHDTLVKRTAAHGRLVEVIDRVRALTNDWGELGRDVPCRDLRAALDEVTP